MNLVVGLTHKSGVRLAEVGFLLMPIAGVWALLIIATHWGRFG
jgi:hypothetical protein